MMHLVHPDKCTDPALERPSVQSIKSLAVVSDPDATRQWSMTKLEGLLRRALSEIRNPAETAAEVINFCNGLLRRRKRLKRGGVSARGQREWQTGHRVLQEIGAGRVRSSAT